MRARQSKGGTDVSDELTSTPTVDLRMESARGTSNGITRLRSDTHKQSKPEYGCSSAVGLRTAVDLAGAGVAEWTNKQKRLHPLEAKTDTQTQMMLLKHES